MLRWEQSRELVDGVKCLRALLQDVFPPDSPNEIGTAEDWSTCALSTLLQFTLLTVYPGAKYFGGRGDR